MRAKKTIPIYPKNGATHEMPKIKPTNKPVSAAQCQAESTFSCRAQAASITIGKSAIPDNKYTRLITADCSITVNKITGTATKLRILLRSWSRCQWRDIYWLEINNYQHNLKAIKINNRLNSSLLKQIEVAGTNITNLSNDQVWRVATAQTRSQYQISRLNIDILRDKLQRDISGQRTHQRRFCLCVLEANIDARSRVGDQLNTGRICYDRIHASDQTLVCDNGHPAQDAIVGAAINDHLVQKWTWVATDHSGRQISIFRIRLLKIHECRQNLCLSNLLLKLNHLGLQLRHLALQLYITLTQRGNITRRG